MNATAFQQHYDNLAEPDTEELELLADAAGMSVEDFMAECEKRAARNKADQAVDEKYFRSVERY